MPAAPRLGLADLQGQVHRLERVDLRVGEPHPQVDFQQAVALQAGALLRELRAARLQVRVVRDGVRLRLSQRVAVDPLCARRPWRRRAACRLC